MGRRVARKEERRKNRNLKVKIGGGIVAAVCVAYLVSCAVVPGDTILKGVSVNHVDLGGMTQEQAATRLTEEFEKNYADASLTVNAVENDYSLPMYASISFDAEAAAKEAFAYGHGNFLLRGYELIKGYTLGQEESAYPSVTNEEALDAELLNCGLTELNTTVQTSYELKEEELEFTVGKTGYTVDMDALKDSIAKAVDADDYETVITAPLVQGSVDTVDMEAVYQEIHKEKSDATIKVSGKKKNKYKVVKSVTGIDFDKTAAIDALSAAAEGELVKVPVTKEEPSISTKDLKKHLFEKTIGKCTTIVSGTDARISNVKLAAKTINGRILMPGEEFSYNDVVGERTSEAGYQKAPAYSDGQTVQELGGGVCQVSSTLYKAIVLANMEILEHHNHTYESSYIGLGMDATVSWNGPDLRFKNNSTYPIQIKMEYENGELTCKIKGAKLDDYSVEFESEILKTVSYKTTYEKDDSMYKGETKVLQSGHNGYVVQTYRVIVDSKGKEISREKEDKCTYSKKDEIVAKGTKKKATTAAKKDTTKTTEKSTKTDTSATTAAKKKN